MALSVTELAARLQPGQRLLGLDPGSKTLGVAVSDSALKVASPLETIKRGKFADDAARLALLCRDYRIGGLVIGLPVNMDGSEGPRAQASRAYARNLAAKLGMPVLLWDERWSTVSAESAMIGQDLSRAKRAERIDSHAAAVILQAAIDALTGTGF